MGYESYWVVMLFSRFPERDMRAPMWLFSPVLQMGSVDLEFHTSFIILNPTHSSLIRYSSDHHSPPHFWFSSWYSIIAEVSSRSHCFTLQIILSSTPPDTVFDNLYYCSKNNLLEDISSYYFQEHKKIVHPTALNYQSVTLSKIKEIQLLYFLLCLDENVPYSMFGFPVIFKISNTIINKIGTQLMLFFRSKI